MLLLAIELYKGGEHASNFTSSEREYKHKHFQDYQKTGARWGFLNRIPMIFLTVPRWSPVELYYATISSEHAFILGLVALIIWKQTATAAEESHDYILPAFKPFKLPRLNASP